MAGPGQSSATVFGGVSVWERANGSQFTKVTKLERDL